MLEPEEADEIIYELTKGKIMPKSKNEIRQY